MTNKEERECVTLINQGKKIFGVLHYPHAIKEPVAAVLICSGFAGNKCGKFRVFVTLAQELAKQGIAVLRFDYRGTGDSEGEYSDITIESQISDVLLCLNYLKENPKIDASRIGILGRSLGGMIAILAANQFPHLKSIALWAPVFTSQPWKKLFESLRSQNGSMVEHFSRLPVNVPAMPGKEFLKQFFQVDLLKELDQIAHIPLLHIHGKQDEFVKFEQAIEYENACKKYSKTSFIQLPNSNHDFSIAEEREIAIMKTYQWFKENL